MALSARAGAPVASVIVRTRNEAATVGRVLDAVYAQEGVGPLEVIVLDSGSGDGTLDVVRRFPVVLHEIASDAFTYGSSLNLGARLARAAICVHLSAHCVPTHREWLQRLLAPLIDPAVVAAYGRQSAVPGVNPYEEIALGRIFPSGPLRAGARQYFSNANCAIRREALLRHPFHETITIMEDALWCLELQPSERVVYVPEAEVQHSHPLRLRYWYDRHWRDGVAYRQIQALRGVTLLSLRPRKRMIAVAKEFVMMARELPRRGYWWHLAVFPLYSVVREIAVQRGARAAPALPATRSVVGSRQADTPASAPRSS